ncbi:bacteriohemerythrin [Geofilum sp. OHC36d9]|uniref:bacteriohemerythrin n=1 Tax=Geofilum sp. OHC36d9 TaxID=3458413 RepID=UPI0040344383
MIQWSVNYSVKNEQLDQEHQTLFAALDKFYEGLKSGEGKQSLVQLMHELIDYAKGHFSNEEAFMKRIEFPGLASHSIEHQSFVKQVNDFLMRYEAGEIPASYEITHFIMDWITRHIKREDMQYAKWYLQRAGRM